MILTDLLKGNRKTGKILRPLALSLAYISGCSDRPAAIGDGGNDSNPSMYGRICGDYSDALISIGADAQTVTREYQECLDNCEPEALDSQKCTGIYCMVLASEDRDYTDLAVLRDCLNGLDSQ